MIPQRWPLIKGESINWEEALAGRESARRELRVFHSSSHISAGALRWDSINGQPARQGD